MGVCLVVGWGVGVPSPRPLAVGQLSGVLPRVDVGQALGVAVDMSHGLHNQRQRATTAPSYSAGLYRQGYSSQL